MFKSGITRTDQLTAANLGDSHEASFRVRNLYSIFKSRKIIAMDLYDHLDALPAPEQDRIQARMLARFSMDNGTLKYTHSQRFEEFDALMMAQITAHFKYAPSVHDMAASDGRTSCGFYERLVATFGNGVDFTASDYGPVVYVLRKKRSHNRIITGEDDTILQIVVPPFVLMCVKPESRLFYPVNHIVRFLALRFLAGPLLAGYRAGDKTVTRTPLELLCRQARIYRDTRRHFRFMKYDMLAGPTAPVEIVRAMNILNDSYFSEAQLRTAVGHLKDSLRSGGLLVTGSNTEKGTVVNGAIYRKDGEQMQLLATSGTGSPVHDLIIS